MNIPFTPPVQTVADLLRQLGDIPPHRVRWSPVPGTATIDDLLRPENEGCELVDGTLVEKTVGQEESLLASWLITLMNGFVIPRNLGIVTGEHGFFDLPDGPVRGPDVAFVSWNQMPGRQRIRVPYPRQAPDLAVEILSPNNARAEMDRKRGEYFRSGVRRVWEIDPRARTVAVYTDADSFSTLSAADTLDAGDVLPGFALPLAQLFAELDRHG
jgi:Uma2 family endonuclease